MHSVNCFLFVFVLQSEALLNNHLKENGEMQKMAVHQTPKYFCFLSLSLTLVFSYRAVKVKMGATIQ